jgi:hypothetical protein
MPLPAGRWKINVNGTEGELNIDAVPNQQGQISGDILSKGFKGMWDETSQSITIIVVLTPGDFGTIALYKGYLSRTPPNPEPGRDVVAILAGSVQVNEGNGFPPARASSRRNIFGWFAQIPEVV